MTTSIEFLRLFPEFNSINPFMTEAAYHTETSPMICFANQWTGFHMLTASVMKGLICHCVSSLKTDYPDHGRSSISHGHFSILLILNKFCPVGSLFM